MSNTLYIWLIHALQAYILSKLFPSFTVFLILRAQAVFHHHQRGRRSASYGILLSTKNGHNLWRLCPLCDMIYLCSFEKGYPSFQKVERKPAIQDLFIR